jgi:hypothetical protein
LLVLDALRDPEVRAKTKAIEAEVYGRKAQWRVTDGDLGPFLLVRYRSVDDTAWYGWDVANGLGLADLDAPSPRACGGWR